MLLDAVKYICDSPLRPARLKTNKPSKKITKNKRLLGLPDGSKEQLTRPPRSDN